MQAGSVSRIKLVADVVGKGAAYCELIRHLAPLSSNALLKGLPVSDRIHRFEDKFVYIETKLIVGAEKAKVKFKRGDIAFLPSNGAVCFILKDCNTQPMNTIGRITNNIEAIEQVQTGDIIALKKEQGPDADAAANGPT